MYAIGGRQKYKGRYVIPHGKQRYSRPLTGLERAEWADRLDRIIAGGDYGKKLTLEDVQ